MKNSLVWITLFISILFEISFTTIPFVLDILLVFYIIRQEQKIAVAGLLSGIILDIGRIRPIGISSIYFLFFLFLVFLYKRKFETATVPFVFIASFIGGMGYLYFLNQEFLIIQALMNSALTIVLFKGLSQLKVQSAK